jgi:hypothetical protein
MTKAKGTTVVPLQKFIREKFGQDGYDQWLSALTPEAKRVFQGVILTDQWYPLDELYIAPTEVMCRLFYHGEIRGARELGRFSADFALKGIYRAFVKLGFVKAFIRRAGVILPTYYQPSAIEIAAIEDNRAVFRITQFPGMHPVVEQRIAGWIERAVEIHGCKEVGVAVAKSLLKGDACTELVLTWK